MDTVAVTITTEKADEHILSINPWEDSVYNKSLTKFTEYTTLRDNGLLKFTTSLLSNAQYRSASDLFQFSQMKKLKHIFATGHKRITHLPDSITMLSDLESLKVYQCSLVELPKNIGNLKKLEVLEIWDNPIKILPESIGGLSELKSLRADGIKIKKIPKTIGLLSKLESLMIGSDNLTEIPVEIGNLTSLVKFIIIYSSNITFLPDSFGKLINLELFGFYNFVPKCYQPGHRGYLKSLPESMKNLTKLQTIKLKGNSFTEIPSFIQHLKNLKSLDIGKNFCSVFPEWIRNLSKLEYLDTHGNKVDTSDMTFTERLNAPSIRETDEVITILKNIKTLEAYSIEYYCVHIYNSSIEYSTIY